MARSVKNTKVDEKNKRNKKLAMTLIIVGIISTVAVIIMAICGVFDSGKVKEIRSSREDRQVVGEIGGYKVRYEELKYVTYVIKEQYREKYGEDIWDSEESAAKYRDQLEAEVIESLKEIYATAVICDEVGIKVNNSDAKAYTQAQIEDIVAKDFRGDFNAYCEYLTKNNLTDAFMRFKTKTVYLDLQAKTKMIESGNERIKYTDANAKEFINYVLNSDDFFRAIHIYYEKTGDAVTDAAKLAEAEAIVAELNAISDNEERYEKMKYYIGHNGDYKSGYVTDTKAGLYITEGVMGEEYDAAALSVDLCGVAIAETQYEYFVIMRMPKDESDIQKNYDKIIGYYHEKIYFDYKNEVIARTEFTPNKFYDGLDLVNIVD